MTRTSTYALISFDYISVLRGPGSLEKTLVTGASGLLGSRVVDVLSKEYEVIPTHNMQSLHPNSIRMDIADRDRVLNVFDKTSPNVVVHTAAETNVDRCETNKEWAWKVNAIGTRNIAKASAEVGAKLIYISTDYVFDGCRGRYTEQDETNPINYYGLSKLKGEEFVKELCEDFVVARTSVLYGQGLGKLNFATWVIDSLTNGRKVSVAEDHFNSPTLADNLAEIIRRMTNCRGKVYHAAGSERVSRYEFALKIAEVFELDRSLLAPVKMKDLQVWIAKRPRDSSLCVDKLRHEMGVQPLDLTEALRKMKEASSA